MDEINGCANANAGIAGIVGIAGIATDTMSKIEYVVVPKREWELLNKDLESMQDIITVQSRELNAIHSKEFQQFERVQEEMVIGQFAIWMQEHKLAQCGVTDLKSRPDFTQFLQHIQIGCAKAREEYMKRFRIRLKTPLS